MNSKWTNRDGTRMRCGAPECGSLVFVKGLCKMHYHRNYRHGSLSNPGYDYLPVCPVDHCGNRMRESSKVCKRCYQKSWRYGLSPEAYVHLSRPENYVCHNPGCRSTERLHLDHDHSCCEQASTLRGGKKACGNCVRGWLCSGCNTALGLLNEDRGRIAGLSAYLERFTR